MKIDTQTLKQLGTVGILLVSVVLVSFLGNIISEKFSTNTESESVASLSLDEHIAPSPGVVLPIKWASLGRRILDTGVIDIKKFTDLYQARGGLSDDMQELFSESKDGTITIHRENSAELLNLLWAFGLSNKNEILEMGPMTDPRYGGDAGRFASTGGWSIASGNPMDHYSKHPFVVLTPEEQKRVENVSKGIYRPCCGNSTYFPDCNHGMAMLGLLQLLAEAGLDEGEMFDVALSVNSYWFPDTYMNIAQYFEKNGIEWGNVDAQLALGENVSSANGYRRVLSEIQPVNSGGGGGCSA